MSDDSVDPGQEVLMGIAREAYKDIAQPSARRIGLSLETLVKVALSPIDLVNWGFEQSKEWLRAKIVTRLSGTPADCVVAPTANIAHAALSRIALSSDTPELRDLYAELLLKSMDSRTANSVHPAYFHLVEQLAPEEALVLVGLHELGREDVFSEKASQRGGYLGRPEPATVEAQFEQFCMSVLPTKPSQPQVWLTNLYRLGLLSLQAYSEAVFREEDHNRFGYQPPGVDNNESRYMMFTDFGRAFIDACAPRNPDSVPSNDTKQTL